MKKFYMGAAVVFLGFLVANAVLGQGGPPGRQRPSDHYRGNTPPPAQMVLTPHGGQYLATRSNRFELVFLPLQTRIYLFDKEFKPVTAKDIHASMTLQLPEESKPQQIPFQFVAPASGQDYLLVSFDLSLLRDKETPITIELSNLPDRDRPAAVFTPVFTPENIRPYVAKVLLRKSEEEAVRHQHTCPVCGRALGSRGPVVKIMIAEYELYLCNDECIAAVRKAPAKFLPQPPTQQPNGATAGSENPNPETGKN
jgi:hypothetical protein